MNEEATCLFFGLPWAVLWRASHRVCVRESMSNSSIPLQTPLCASCDLVLRHSLLSASSHFTILGAHINDHILLQNLCK
jgi:hypothetical protein